MGRRGPQPEYAKREAFAKLIAEGVPSQRASLIVGINPRTGKRWRNGRKVKSGGRMLDLPPVINPRPDKRYSPRYLSEDERIRLADLRRERLSNRAIADLMDRSPSTISRELQRGSDSAGRYRPHEAQAAGSRSSSRAPAEPAVPRRRTARVGRYEAHGSVEPGADLTRAAPRVSRSARAVAVHRVDLPGRLPTRSGRSSP